MQYKIGVCNCVCNTVIYLIGRKSMLTYKPFIILNDKRLLIASHISILSNFCKKANNYQNHLLIEMEEKSVGVYMNLSNGQIIVDRYVYPLLLFSSLHS